MTNGERWSGGATRSAAQRFASSVAPDRSRARVLFTRKPFFLSLCLVLFYHFFYMAVNRCRARTSSSVHDSSTSQPDRNELVRESFG